jgi:hypothetical protein
MFKTLLRVVVWWIVLVPGAFVVLGQWIFFDWLFLPVEKRDSLDILKDVLKGPPAWFRRK